MKTLLLVRHAKSDWSYPDLKDIDRPLNERGYSDGYIMSRWYKNEPRLPVPQLIQSSDATRALSTATMFARELNYPRNTIQVVENIYEAEENTLLQHFRKLDEQWNCVMVFGHNPGFTNVTNYFCHEVFIDNIPTTGIVCLQFDIEAWHQIKANSARMLFHKFPRDFRTTL